MIPGRTVIVFGVLSSISRGETCARMLAHFGCSRLVDNWDSRSPLQQGDLAITNREPPFRVRDALVLDVAQVLQRLNRRTE